MNSLVKLCSVANLMPQAFLEVVFVVLTKPAATLLGMLLLLLS